MSETDVSRHTRALYSEGTRLAADLYLPTSVRPAAGFPALLLCHGWGGIKSHLAPYAETLARAGFAVMTFDYRGWGESDGRVIARKDAPPLRTAGELTLPVQVLREVVDPVDQCTDASNCLTALAAEPDVDAARLGLWGTSFGGGHAVFLAGHNPLIRAVVAQVGGFGLTAEYVDHARMRAVEKVHGALDPAVPQGGLDGIPGLLGTPDVARMLGHSPIEAAKNIRVPTLIIDAEFEELVNRLEHGAAVYEIVRQNAVSAYRLLPCAHYGVYGTFAEEAVRLATEWFETHLRG